MKHQGLAILAVVLWWAFPGPRQATAQVATSFEQLQVLVKPGDTIVVTDQQGMSTKGKVQSISRESLNLRSGGNIREFLQRDTIEIKQRRSDSLANGAIIGAISGGTVAAIGAIAICNDESCDGEGAEIAAVVGIYAGVGAAIGVGIDALIRPRRTIYRSPGQSAFSDIQVAPLVGGGRRGVALRWRF